MKTLVSLFTALLLSLTLSQRVSAQVTWQLDKSHSNINFSVAHLVVSETSGRFKSFDAKVISKSDDFVDSEIELVIDAASINTEDEKRDGHLRSADFFDVAKYPHITFKSKSFKKVDGKNYKLVGDLTMHGVTKEVTLDVIYNGTAKSPFGNIHAGFKVIGKINRTDFGLKWNKALDNGGVLVGEEVSFICNIELTRKS
ncbi:MAG: YceI family protein [Chloroherpetonaceae bacterium]|nr:YceI family protein [Chloroherpetonaceae bacterium]MCS7211223.1 YceI family protein [Chloroherpetonaceae bacterium]MDW8019961.1 YceI family protein [Chloroherpetonaceae bacterium]